MESLARRIGAARVPRGSVALWWLGQAGFAFKTAAGTVVYVDPYLSDAVERLDGFRRLSLPALAAEEVEAGLVVITHEHHDHLDVDALPVIVERNPRARFAAPACCREGLTKAGVKDAGLSVLVPGTPVQLGDVTIHAAPADHGSFSPGAVSIALDLGGPRIMLSGDTSWRADYFAPLYALGLDVVIPCINGTFGNMNHLDAARMAAESGAALAIPCHFWTFAEQGGCDPLGFVLACGRFAPEMKAQLLRPGEELVVKGARGA
jgi:L-ascorbate 6-phosphate lactonase